MHQVKYTYRRILPSEIPTVIPDGEEDARPMTDAELLNMGMARVGGDIFSCIHQEERDPHTLEWRAHVTHPGEVLSEGSFRERHARLPADVRTQVTVARVIRSGKQLHIPHSDIHPDDQVEGEVPLHSWDGENRH